MSLRAMSQNMFFSRAKPMTRHLPQVAFEGIIRARDGRSSALTSIQRHERLVDYRRCIFFLLLGSRLPATSPPQLEGLVPRSWMHRCSASHPDRRPWRVEDSRLRRRVSLVLIDVCIAIERCEGTARGPENDREHQETARGQTSLVFSATFPRLESRSLLPWSSTPRGRCRILVCRPCRSGSSKNSPRPPLWLLLGVLLRRRRSHRRRLYPKRTCRPDQRANPGSLVFQRCCRFRA